MWLNNSVTIQLVIPDVCTKFQNPTWSSSWEIFEFNFVMSWDMVWEFLFSFKHISTFPNYHFFMRCFSQWALLLFPKHWKGTLLSVVELGRQRREHPALILKIINPSFPFGLNITHLNIEKFSTFYFLVEIHIRPKENIYVFPVSRPTLFFPATLKFLLAFKKKWNSITRNLPYVWPFFIGFATFVVIIFRKFFEHLPKQTSFHFIFLANNTSFVFLIK